MLVRSFVGDHKKHLNQSITWFKEAEMGERSLRIVPTVVAETCYVLESNYKLSRSKIADSFQMLLSQKWIQVIERDVLLRVWPVYISGFHFVDSYLYMYSKVHKTTILTFDKKLQKLG